MLNRKVPDALASICHYCLFLKDMGWKHTAYHIINSDPGDTRSKQQLDTFLKITFATSSKSTDKKGRKKKKRRETVFCDIRKCKKFFQKRTHHIFLNKSDLRRTFSLTTDLQVLHHQTLEHNKNPIVGYLKLNRL